MINGDLPLHLKYRPESFDDFAGNEAMVDSLLSVLSRDKGRPQAFLFYGEPGTGKTSAARIVMKLFGVNEFDLKEINAASDNGITMVRAVEASVALAPMAGPYRGYILDEVHMTTKAAQNALLKVLEEPPSHVVFALCTTDPSGIVETIRSRCSQYKTTPLSDKRMAKLVKDICIKEGLDNYPETIVKEIVKVASGSSRNALKILDQVIDITDDRKAIKAVKDYKTDESTVDDMCKVMTSADRKWSRMRDLLLNFTGDPEGCRRAILSWLTNIALREDPQRASALIDIFAEPYYNVGKAGLVRDCFYGCDPDR